MSEKLRLAKQQMGSAGRESAEKQRKLEQVMRKRTPAPYGVEVVPNAPMGMPSKKSMVREGRMDLANKPSPEFGKEMARERKRQQREYSGY